eukprot:5963536-Pleurochrysis_carterae.AAC.5
MDQKDTLRIALHKLALHAINAGASQHRRDGHIEQQSPKSRHGAERASVATCVDPHARPPLRFRRGVE